MWLGRRGATTVSLQRLGSVAGRMVATVGTPIGARGPGLLSQRARDSHGVHCAPCSLFTGSAIACGGSDGRTVVVGLRSGRSTPPVAHGSPVRMVRFSCTSRFMATVSDVQVRFWDLKQDPASQLVFAFDMPARPLDADIDASQSRLAVAAADGAVYLWDLTAPPSTGPVAVDGGEGFVAARFFATGHPTAEPLVVTAEGTGTVRVWNMGPAPRRQKRPRQGTAEEESAIDEAVGSAKEEGAWEPLWAAPLTARHAARDDVVLATCCPYNGPASARVPGSKRVSPLCEPGPLYIASADGAGTLHLLDARARAHLITVDLGVAVTAVAMDASAKVMLLGDAGGESSSITRQSFAGHLQVNRVKPQGGPCVAALSSLHCSLRPARAPSRLRPDAGAPARLRPDARGFSLVRLQAQ